MGGRRAVDRSAGYGARAIEGTVFSQRASTTDRRSINRLTGEINHKPEPVEASVLVESVRSVPASEPIVAETRPKQRPASAYEGAVKYHQPPAPPESIDTYKDSGTIVWSALPTEYSESQTDRNIAMGPETLLAMEKIADKNASGLPFSDVERT